MGGAARPTCKFWQTWADCMAAIEDAVARGNQPRQLSATERMTAQQRAARRGGRPGVIG